MTMFMGVGTWCVAGCWKLHGAHRSGRCSNYSIASRASRGSKEGCNTYTQQQHACTHLDDAAGVHRRCWQ